jgi:Xaa-Pro aminopeptidase
VRSALPLVYERAHRIADVAATPLIRRRGQRIWQRLEAARLDAIVVFGHGTIGAYGYLAYACGYAPVLRAAHVVLFRDEDPVVVVTREADAWHARTRAGIVDVRVAGAPESFEWDDLTGGVSGVLRERAAEAGRIGVVGMRHAASAWEAERLRILLPEAELVDVTADVNAVKAVKDPEDIAELEATAAIADEVFEAFLAQVRPGVTGWEMNAVIESAARSRGVKDTLIFVSSGAFFSDRPTSDPFADGDLLTVYVEIVGPTGYWVELARLVGLGRVDDDRAAIAAACLGAARAAEVMLVSGRTASEVARTIDGIAAAAGARSGSVHGHGVGVDHDAPVITEGNNTVLESDMVISLHPAFSTADAQFGASVADTYVVGSGHPRRLSRLDPGLIRV